LNQLTKLETNNAVARTVATLKLLRDINFWVVKNEDMMYSLLAILVSCRMAQLFYRKAIY